MSLLFLKRFAGASALPAVITVLTGAGTARAEGYPWGAESARVTGRYIAVQHVLAGARPRVEESAATATAMLAAGKVPGVVGTGANGLLTIVVPGVNTAAEGHKLGESAAGLGILARSLYGKSVPTVTIGRNSPLPDFSKLGKDVIINVDMDVDLANHRRFGSWTPVALANLQGQTQWAGTTIEQLSAAYKQAYPGEPVFALGHSAGSAGIVQSVERGAQLDKIDLFSPQHPPDTLAGIVQTAGLKPEQVLVSTGSGDPYDRGGPWNSNPAFQHLEAQVPGHSIGLGTLRTDPQVIAEGSFLRNLGLGQQAIHTNYLALHQRFLFSSNAAMNSMNRQFNTRNFQSNFGNSHWDWKR